jgi:hypothetical protein
MKSFMHITVLALVCYGKWRFQGHICLSVVNAHKFVTSSLRNDHVSL